MAEGVDLAGTLGIGNINFAGAGNAFLLILGIIVVAFLILGGIGILLYFYINNKKYKFIIPLYSKVGNVTTRVGMAKAKPVPFGRAGDTLWYVKGKGFTKWIAPAQIQSAKNEFWHYIREDGEWINFSMDDLDEVSKKAGVQYVKQEARLTRLAIDRLLEQRLDKKSFWEKYGLIIGYAIFFIVITLALIIFFHQYGTILEKTDSIMARADTIMQRIQQYENEQSKGGLIPAFVLPLMIRRKSTNGNKRNR